MAYEQYEVALMNTFGKQLKSGEIILAEESELKSSKSRQKYNKFINDIQTIKPHAYKKNEFGLIGQDSVLELTLEILITIFGESIYPKVIEFFQYLEINNSDEVLDGISITAQDKITGEIHHIVEIPSLEYSSSPVAIAHEFTHFYLKSLNIDFNRKTYYEEILSIYAEKVAYYIIEKRISDSKIAQKIEETRLECINWHYNINLPIATDTINQYIILKNKKQKDAFDIQCLYHLESKLPLIKTAEGVSIIKGYFKNLADSYGIGYLYGESLFQKFLDSPQNIREQLNSIISREQSITNLLEYYGISTTNYQTYNEVNQRLSLIKKSK